MFVFRRRARPFLTARWTDLVMLNFVVPEELIASLAPTGTEPDLFDSMAYASIVGFRFTNIRVLGIPIPGHSAFDEVNLRYYVKRIVDGGVRRGVVFVREIAPRRAVAIIANRIYNESYITCPMQSTLTKHHAALTAGDTLQYTWRSPAIPRFNGQCHNVLRATVASSLALPAENSLDEFIIEHYYGYTRGRDGHTREYRVAHEPWRVAEAANVVWSCDLATTYGEPFAKYLSGTPASALVAEGSHVEVFRGCGIGCGRAPLACRG